MRLLRNGGRASEHAEWDSSYSALVTVRYVGNLAGIAKRPTR